MAEVASEPNDFVRLISTLTNFIENERIRAYNEGVDMMLDQTRAWMRMHEMEPSARHLPELLDEISAAAAKHRGAGG